MGNNSKFDERIHVLENFIDYIKQFIGQKKEITARELAKKVGITEVSMSRYLNKERCIPIETAIKICNVFGIGKNEFINFYSGYFQSSDKYDERCIEDRYYSLSFSNQKKVLEYIEFLCYKENKTQIEKETNELFDEFTEKLRLIKEKK